MTAPKYCTWQRATITHPVPFSGHPAQSIPVSIQLDHNATPKSAGSSLQAPSLVMCREKKTIGPPALRALGIHFQGRGNRTDPCRPHPVTQMMVPCGVTYPERPAPARTSHSAKNPLDHGQCHEPIPASHMPPHPAAETTSPSKRNHVPSQTSRIVLLGGPIPREVPGGEDHRTSCPPGTRNTL